MHIKDILNQSTTTALSFEYFPPKTEKAQKELYENMLSLSSLRPAYVSVTYGAGGSTRELTHDLIKKIKKDTNLTVISHLTCVGSTKQEIHKILDSYNDSGIHNIMALRGDPPKGETKFARTEGGFNYASELVTYIKKYFPHMGIGVAGFPEGHPECPDRLLEIDYLKQKVDAGADYICSQMFFDNRDFYDFCERCEIAGIKVPIIAGIMPITSLKGMKRMSSLALGAKFPAKLLRALSRSKSDDNSISAVGNLWASEQVNDLIDKRVKGIHFYTLNKSESTRKIYESLGLENSDSLKTINELTL